MEGWKTKNEKEGYKSFEVHKLKISFNCDYLAI